MQHKYKRIHVRLTLFNCRILINITQLLLDTKNMTWQDKISQYTLTDVFGCDELLVCPGLYYTDLNAGFSGCKHPKLRLPV